MENLKVKIKLIEGGMLPEYKHDGDVCLDCRARLDEKIKLFPSEWVKVPLGFALELPKGWEAVIRPRSGMSSKGFVAAIGTIDTNYNGEVCAVIYNNAYTISPFIGFSGGDTLEINNGDRICQLAIREAPKIEWEVVNELTETERGDKGFGSTGIN